MKNAPIILLLTLSLFLFVGAASAFFNAQGGGELFTDAPQSLEQIQANGVDQSVHDPTVMRTRYSGVNLPAAERIQPGDTLALRLFDDAIFTMLPSEIRRDGERVSISGALQDVPDSLAILTTSGGQLALDVILPGSIYQARWLADGLYAIRQIDQSVFPEELPPLEVTEAMLAESAQSSEALPAAPAAIGGDDGSVIEVFVVYTTNALNLNGGISGIQNLITNAVSATNLSYQYSGITQRLHVADMREVVGYSESGNMETDLLRMQVPGDGYMDAVHAWRNETNADVVTLIVGSGQFCGVGYQMDSVVPGFSNYAFSVVLDDCAVINFSLAHELGHNMGARHDWYMDGNTTPYRYSHGHINFANRWRTIMSYDNYCLDRGSSCTRILRWSNPNLTYGGNPLGVPEFTCIGIVGCDADEARTLNSTAYTVANFRVAPTPTATPTRTPTPTPTSTPTPTPPYTVLLVDEDDNNPNVQAFYAAPLSTLKVTVSIYEVQNTQTPEPDAAKLALNEAVVWFTGDNYASSTGPGDQTELALASWLQAGGCLFISSQDYFYAKNIPVPNAFMRDYLGVFSIGEDVNQTVVTGAGSPFNRLYTYPLATPAGFAGNFSDLIQPVPNTGPSFLGNQGSAGAYLENSIFKTIYLGFPLEMVSSQADRTAILQRFLYWCRFWEQFLPRITR